jgi:hypothetical protein
MAGIRDPFSLSKAVLGNRDHRRLSLRHLAAKEERAERLRAQADRGEDDGATAQGRPRCQDSVVRCGR